MTTETPTRQDFVDIVHRVGAEYGFPDPPLEDALGLLWEFTGYPCFWDGPPLEVCETQVRAFFEENKDDIDH